MVSIYFVKSIYRENYLYKKVGIILSDITSDANIQIDIFDDININCGQKYHINIMYNHAKFGVEGQVTMWKKSIGMTASFIAHRTFEKRSRPFTVVKFDNGLKFINIHAGHKYKSNDFYWI